MVKIVLIEGPVVLMGTNWFRLGILSIYFVFILSSHFTFAYIGDFQKTGACIYDASRMYIFTYALCLTKVILVVFLFNIFSYLDLYSQMTQCLCTMVAKMRA